MSVATATAEGAALVEVVPTGAALGRGSPGRGPPPVGRCALRRGPRGVARAFRAAVPRPVASDDELIAFSRRFGALDWAPVQENGRRFVEGKPEIYIVSNVLGADGQPIGSLGAGEAVWHTDMSYLPEPPKASMLYALEVPPAGGDTHFASMYAAHDALPEALQRARAGAQGEARRHLQQRRLPPRRGDADGRPAHLARATCTRWCAGIPRPGGRCCIWAAAATPTSTACRSPNSEALLDELWEHATRPDIGWAHRWRPGDLVLWDNRCTMHRRDPFDAASRRVMHRTQVKGEAPPAA